jgi:TonB dependent receptor-like, beta-barrel/TonB-dependent Receptor Plug Domain
MARAVASILCAVAMVCVPSASSGHQAEAKRYAGRTVADVLKELQATSLKIIFSSERVPPALRVVREPRATNARDIALEILEPHGLTLEQGPGGIFIVVAKLRRDRGRPRLAPKRDSTPAVTPETEPLRIAESIDVTDRPGVSDMSSRSYVVDPLEVREMAGGLDNVLQSLQVLPGVAATNDEDGKLAVRGAGPEHNLVVLDGVQIHNVQRLGEFTTSFFNPATAANITLDPSGLDARFGGRLSSVVNLETRDGTTARRLAFSGSLGLTSGDVLLEGRVPGTTAASWWATVRGTYYRLVADRFDDGAMPSFADIQFKTTFYPSRRTRLTVFGLAGREMLQELNREPDGDVLTTASTKGENRIAAATLRWIPTSRVSSATTVSAYSTTSRERARFFALGIDPLDRNLLIDDYAVRHQVLFASSHGQLMDAGVDLHRVRSSWRMTGIKQPEWWRGIGPSTTGELVDYSDGPVESQLQRTQVGGWFQVSLDAGKVVTLEPGIRFDWNSYTSEAAWQPRLRLSRAFGKTLGWTGISVQAQTPSHESLQGFEYFQFAPDGAGLQNARTQQVVAGFERPLGAGLSLRVEGYGRTFDRLLVQRLETEAEYRRRLTNYVIPEDLPADAVILEHRPTIFPESIGDGRAHGLEVLLERERRRVSGWVGYTLSKSTRDLYGNTVPSDFDRRHALNAVVAIPIAARWRAAATMQLASGLPTTPVQQEVDFGQVVRLDGTRDPFFRPFRDRNGKLVTFADVFERRLSSINSERTTAYSRVDARLTYATVRHWEFYVEVLNAFNHRNYVQTVNDKTADGEVREIGRANIYNTFERMLSFGMRATF